MPKKDVFLSQEEIDFIKATTGGKYSEWIRKAVQEKIERENHLLIKWIKDLDTM